MALLWILGAALQCALLFWLWRAGARGLRQPVPAAPDVQQWGPQGGVGRLPKVALFVPCAGAHPAMAAALRSLATQDYPKMLLVLITADAADPASALAAAEALAELISEDELCADYIIPKAFDPRVGPAVAKAVAQAARESGVARG